MTEAKMFGFYTINAEYLKFLHDKDSEVYYNKEYHTLKKNFCWYYYWVGEKQIFYSINLS